MIERWLPLRVVAPSCARCAPHKASVPIGSKLKVGPILNGRTRRENAFETRDLFAAGSVRCGLPLVISNPADRVRLDDGWRYVGWTSPTGEFPSRRNPPGVAQGIPWSLPVVLSHCLVALVRAVLSSGHR